MNIACDISAISPGERSLHNELLQRVRKSIRGRFEHPDGYTFTLDEQTIGLPDLTQWITMERLCCPFLKFTLSLSGAEPGWSLTLQGPEGTKSILRAEF